MALLKVLISAVSGVMLGGSAIGIVSTNVLHQPNNEKKLQDDDQHTRTLEEKNRIITELVEELAQQSQDLLNAKFNYETKIADLKKQLQELNTQGKKFEGKKKSLEEQVNLKESELSKTKEELNSNKANLEKTISQLEELKAQIQQEETKLLSTRTDKDLLEKENAEFQKEIYEIQAEKGVLNGQVQQLNQLRRVVELLEKAGVKSDQIKDFSSYETNVMSVATQKRKSMRDMDTKIKNELARLTKELRSGKNVRVNGGLHNFSFIGSKEDEDKFIEELKKLFETLEEKGS